MVDCKICEHPYCQYAGEQRGFVINCTNYMPRQKPQTNADRIRAMSDEELATDLLDMFEEICEDGVPSKEWMLMWLQQPVKGGDTDG